MIVPGSRSAMAHFQRFGPISFRLARAMLGSDEAAGEALERAFADFGCDGARWPEWHVALDAVHRECAASQSGSDNGVPAPASPAEDDTAPVPATTMSDALASLPHENRTILWRALMGAAGPEESAMLAAALRRLDIAVDNQHIPGEEDPQWQP